jgi:hypothetical protein
MTTPRQTWLNSWTRTLNEAEAYTLLDHARPGLSLEQWAVEGHGLLPQGSVARRRELLHIVREELLDHDGTTIQDSAFGKLFHEGDARRRKCLMYGRLLAGRPLVRPALDLLVTPRLARLDVPKPPADADRIPPEAWDIWLRQALRPGIPDEAFKKTRSTLQTALENAGVVTVIGHPHRTVRVHHSEPDPLAYAWVVAAELRAAGHDADETWATRDAFAARLFGARAAYAATCLQAGVEAGLLTRSAAGRHGPGAA